MALHLLKLCVGCDSIADLEGWIEDTMALWRRLGKPEEQIHTTRMVPKRIDEILDGGSLYWVIKGQIACRQRLTDIRPSPMARASAAATSCWSRKSSLSRRAPAVPSRDGATSSRTPPPGTSAAAATSPLCPRTCAASSLNSACSDARSVRVAPQ